VSIRYSAWDSGDEAKIDIYDASGRLVRTFSRLRGNAINGLTWDGTDSRGNVLANGVYFVQLSGVPDVLMRKVVIAR
jgi:flagellar hook assembly protein FlgD